MMGAGGDDNEQLLPPDVQIAAVPVKLDQLAPWHRPRKHFIRKSQWARYAVDLVRDVLTPAREEKLKYLTLPGLDYFDVEVLAEATAELGLAVELTAFQNRATNPAIQARCHIRTESLVKRGLVDDTADTLPYSIEEIVNWSSQAARALRKRGPFDVINIDACGALAHPDRQPKLIHVLHKIIEFQQNKSRRRWLLFVTVDIRREHTSPETLEQLSESLTRNINGSAEFSSKFEELSEKFSWNSARSMHEDDLSRDSFLKQTTLALSKWLIHLGEEADWFVNSKSQYCYSTEGEDPDSPTMACLAFEFIPKDRPLHDPANIGTPAQPHADRPDYHIKAAEKIERIQNLDIRMRDQEDLRRQLAEEQLALLDRAGYTPEAQATYRARFLE